MQTSEAPVRPADTIVPMDLWSKDHWSTLAYLETVMVEHEGRFQVGWDPRMRQNRRHFRVMWEQCPTPLRTKADSSRDSADSSRDSGPIRGVVMENAHATRLSDGSHVSKHDDWACVQDMAEAGLFLAADSVTPLAMADVEPGVILRLSERGAALCDALRAHKRKPGGRFATFRPSPDLMPRAAEPVG